MTPDQTRRRRYRGGLTNTDRWDRFAGRPGDVFVSTPPKCGTTWTTTIVTMLCQGTTDVNPTESVQWIDAEVVPLDQAIASVEAQQHRRCIKSHTPLDGMPYSSDACYIAVYRHPLDMLFSLRKHAANMKITPPDSPNLADIETNLRYFVSQAVDYDEYDDGTLGAIIEHYISFSRPPVPDNVLAIHYADLKSDARHVIELISDHMGLDRDAALLDAVFKASSFDRMKADPVRFAPFANREFWHDTSEFFHSASQRKWQGQLSDTALSMYNDKMDNVLSGAQKAWLENGSGAPAA